MPALPNQSPWYSQCWRRLRSAVRLPSLVRRGLPIVGATLLSRPLGYLRVGLQAWWFGATAEMDAFVLAFAVPSILQVVLLDRTVKWCFSPYAHDVSGRSSRF